MKVRSYLSAAAALTAFASSASAELYQFSRLSGNGSQNVASQLSMNVSDLGNGSVFIRIANSGPLASVVTQVFFDNDGGVLGSLTGIDNTSGDGIDGVDFRTAAPGANFPAKPSGWDTDFAAFARSPRPVHGVDPGEAVGFQFALTSGRSYGDFIAALNSGKLRTGLHVQAMSDGQSDSFVTSLVPSPAAAGLAVVGLASVASLRRRLS